MRSLLRTSFFPLFLQQRVSAAGAAMQTPLRDQQDLFDAYEALLAAHHDRQAGLAWAGSATVDAPPQSPPLPPPGLGLGLVPLPGALGGWRVDEVAPGVGGGRSARFWSGLQCYLSDH